MATRTISAGRLKRGYLIMHHHLRLEFNQLTDATIAWLRSADQLSLQYPERGTFDTAKPLPNTLTLFGDETRLTFEVQYTSPIPAYSELGPGTPVTLFDALHPPPPDASAIVYGRWEEPAKRSDWKIEPMLPEQRVPLDYQRDITGAQYRWLCNGEIPRQQEDQWFLFHENWTLYIYRSWTGQPVWEVAMTIEGDRYVIPGAWQYTPEGTMAALHSLIDWRCKEGQRIYDRYYPPSQT